ncbi:Hypothetical predicted protein [Cloeon dipterum]|uniref:BHLH domain-containing protein n=1 Tax=Cloeon dipterum TaxID=197152 RepID=A0A8S1D4H1_9INSE|nr:Hypothetical predicted protein [Cloeon dipterum]
MDNNYECGFNEWLDIQNHSFELFDGLHEAIRQDISLYDDGQCMNVINGVDDVKVVDDNFNFDESASLPLECFPGSHLFGEQFSVLVQPLEKFSPERMWTDVVPTVDDVATAISHDHCYLKVLPDVKVPEGYLTPEASEDEIDIVSLDAEPEISHWGTSPAAKSGYGSSIGPSNTLPCATSSQVVAAPLPIYPQASTSRASNLNLSDRRWSDRRSRNCHQQSSGPVASTSQSGGCHGGSRKSSHGITQPEISMFSLPRLVPVVAAEEAPAKRRRGKKAAAPKPSTSKTGGPKSSRKTVTSDERRIRHNNAERKRRAALAELFDGLRNVMPKVQGKKPLPKAKALEFGRKCILRISGNMTDTIAFIRKFSRVQKRMSGLNGTGKSKLGIELARKFAGEVVGADSMQVYKGLDIVTNKVTREEMKQVPHHLIDFLNPTENFNIVDYRNMALSEISDIDSRSKLPIVVGGTNYYIEALLWKVLVQHECKIIKTVAPEASNSVAADVSARCEFTHLSNEELMTRLEAVDAETALRLHPNDRRKVLRALEVFEQEKRPLSEILREQQSEDGSSSIGGPLRFPRSIIFWLQWDQVGFFSAIKCYDGTRLKIK